MSFIEELRWRGMVHGMTPGAPDKLKNGGVTGYAGFDPTAPSLHIGHLIPIMLLVHFQRTGNKPIALVGGATAMIGDPSGKSEERVLLPMDVIRDNQERLRKQLGRFLDFSGPCAAEIVNNHDWFSKIGYLDFLRDVGKHLTVNYMVAKDSVKARWENGISFTEFSYQLLQAYDFLWLYTNKNCILQMGGSDQWGNITTGAELIRRKAGGEAHALTCPLLTRSDGRKFGKSEGGESIWLDPAQTSPYKFYQYWLNCTDDDAPRMLKLFTMLSHDEIRHLETEHSRASHERPLQKALAREMTITVHSKADYAAAVDASDILFGKGTTETLHKLSEKDFLAVFEGVPRADVPRSVLDAGVPVVEFTSEKTQFFASKGEARRMIAQGGLSINKVKVVDENVRVTGEDLLNGRYLLLQKGKKAYCLVRIV
ncbi:MAG: tyrosine--tRNA ligase [Chitinispirillaceae bacterium]|jgi:tyrosyl-tRNA synthetase|nr:tyrosine--tRNA ligase [Chitinispirillaceae bacterium]